MGNLVFNKNCTIKERIILKTSNMITKKHYEELVELGQERNLKYYAWLRQILLMASGLIGILVSLKSNKSESSLEHIAFIVTIISLAMGILTGSIVLYSEIKNLETGKKLYIEQMRKIAEGQPNLSPIVTFNTSSMFRRFEYLCFGFLIFSLIGLMVYAILID
jgi:membrane-associated HD superfamily phosphohydrolase